MKPQTPSSKPDKARRRVRKPDRRAVRSQHALAAALTDLMFERSFDRITVQDVLDGAQVSRSTFYAHFQNRDDLFLASFERMLALLDTRLAADPPGVRRLAPVRELFTHVADFGPIADSLRGSEHLTTIWTLLVLHLARGIERRGGSLFASRLLAGGLVETLKAWLSQRERPTPAQMDAQFHALAWRVVRS